MNHPDHPADPPRVDGGIADTVQLRVNPLPAHRLSTEDLRRSLAHLALIKQQRDSWQPLACDELYALAGTVEDPERRRGVVALRRAIFNGRDPGAAAADGLPEATSAWLALHREHTAVADRIRERYSEAIELERRNLAGLLDSPTFGKAVSLLAPTVHDTAVRYGAAGGATDRKLRKSERGLIQYVTRALLRTSPLSQFTAVGLAHWDEDGPQLDEVEFDGDTARAFAEIDRSVLNHVLGGLPVVGGPAGWVTVSPTLRAEADRVYFPRVDGDRVRMLSAPLTRHLRLLLAMAGMGPYHVDHLAEDLAARTGGSRQADADYVAKVVSAGMLTAVPGPDEQDRTGLRALGRRLLDDHPAAGLLLEELADVVEGIETAPAGQRPALVGRLPHLEERLLEVSGRPARLHVNEDLVFPPTAPSPAGHTEALGDLAHVLEFQSAYDRFHEVRAMLTAAFVERFGAGASAGLIEHAEELVNEVYRREDLLRTVGPDGLGPDDGSLGQLHALRRRAVGALAREVHAGRHRDEVIWDAGYLAELTSGLPDRFRAVPLSYGVLIQPAGDLLVVNDAYAGHASLNSRFLHAASSTGGPAVDRLAERLLGLYGADGARVLEDRGLYRTNINLHPQVLPETVTPREWATLTLRHDPSADRLELLDRDGRPVRVLPLGSQYSEMYPFPLRLAYWLVGSGRLVLDLQEKARERLAERDRGGVLGLPRLRAGRVLLHRRRWFLAEGELPQPEAAEEEVSYLLRLTDWRAGHRVSDEVFVKTSLFQQDPSDYVGSASEWRSFIDQRRRGKPQYVDFSSALMARVLPKLLERRGGGYLEEALPRLGESPNTFEWIVEFDRPSGGRFSALRRDVTRAGLVGV